MPEAEEVQSEEKEQEVKEETKSPEEIIREGMKALQGNQYDVERHNFEGPKDEETTDEDSEESEETQELSDREKGLLEDLKKERAKRQELEGQKVEASEIAALKEEIEKLKAAKSAPQNPLAGITDQQLGQYEEQYQAAYEQAILDQDATVKTKALQALKLIRQEVVERARKTEAEKYSTKEPSQKEKARAEELVRIHETARSAVPDFFKEGTEAQKHLQTVMKEFPGLGEFGELGGLLAGALAIIEHPEIVKGKVSKTVSENMKKQLTRKTSVPSGAGGGKPGGKRKLTHEENLALAERIKFGQGSFAEIL